MTNTQNTTIEQQLYATAVDFINQRYPTDWGGCAVMRLESGEFVIGVAPDVKNDALSLCMEVGAALEAHKRNEAVTHSICICREDEHSDFLILSPCGICQERLTHWGGDVQVAITTADNSLQFKALRELQPHHWSLVNGEAL